MNYTDFRDQAQTGDLLLVEGRGLVGTFVRMITGQQASHVAVLLWIRDGLWVAEMRSRGYTLTRASQRIVEMAESGQVYWGKKPKALQWQVETLIGAALRYRGQRYSWWTLVTVWLAQVSRRRMPRNLVCSTLVEKVWSAGGYEFAQTPDPGDFFKLCQSVTPLIVDPLE